MPLVAPIASPALTRGRMATDFLLVLGYAALPVIGNFAGGLLAERLRVSANMLSLAIHAAVGVVFAVIAVELFPTTLAIASPWVVFGGFIAGGGSFLLLDRVTGFVRARMGGKQGAGGLGIFVATSLDLFSDGVMIGAGRSLNPGLGLLLAMGQVPADVPEGFATIATLKREGIPRARRIMYLTAFSFPILLGAALGFFLLRGRPDSWKAAVLAFTAGALATLVVEELSPEAHATDAAAAPWLEGLVFLAGFALFFLLSIMFEAG